MMTWRFVVLFLGMLVLISEAAYCESETVVTTKPTIRNMLSGGTTGLFQYNRTTDIDTLDADNDGAADDTLSSDNYNLAFSLSYGRVVFPGFVLGGTATVLYIATQYTVHADAYGDSKERIASSATYVFGPFLEVGYDLDQPGVFYPYVGLSGGPAINVIHVPNNQAASRDDTGIYFTVYPGVRARFHQNLATYLTLAYTFCSVGSRASHGGSLGIGMTFMW